MKKSYLSSASCIVLVLVLSTISMISTTTSNLYSQIPPTPEDISSSIISLGIKPNENISSSVINHIMSSLSSVLTQQEVSELIEMGGLTKLDNSLRITPKNTDNFYKNLQYILNSLSQNKTIYLESFPTLIKNNFSYFLDLATIKDQYTLEKKVLEFKYNHSIAYRLFELNGIYDFIPVFFDNIILTTSSSKYMPTKTYIIDTLDSWIDEEYLTDEFSSFLQKISSIESLDLLLVLYVLHNNIDTNSFIKIIHSNPYKLLIFKDFIYTMSLYLKDSNLIKTFLSNSTMILNFFNISWEEKSYLQYFNHIITIANLLPQKDRISFILGINTLYPIESKHFSTHIELLQLIQDKLQDHATAVLGSNYNLALNYDELKSLSADIFVKDCYHLMSKK